MREASILLAAWLIGSAIVLLIITVAHLPVVKTYDTYQDLRGVLALCFVSAAVLFLLIGLVRKLWDSAVAWGDVFFAPLAVSWVLVLCLIGLHIVARVRGISKRSASP